MAYINNGTNRSLYITVDKQVGGNQVQGYPVTYNGQNAFPGYLILTDEEVRQLSTGDFDTRYDAFEAYVESIEDGVEFDTDIVGDGATKYDPDVCLATTTTTYTTAAPVYGFSVKYGQYSVDVCSGTDSVVYSSTQTPVVGTILYKDLALTQPWDTTNGEHVLFVSPIIYGELAVEVSLTTGAIVQVTTFDCGGVTEPEPEPEPEPEYKNLNITISDVGTPGETSGLGGTLYVNDSPDVITKYSMMHLYSSNFEINTAVIILFGSIELWDCAVAGQSYIRVSSDNGVTWSDNITNYWATMSDDVVLLVEVRATPFSS